MLAAHPIDVMLLATDLNTAKDFYGHKVGLEIILESPAPAQGGPRPVRQ